MNPKVLWIEDGGRLELVSLCGPVYYSGTCDLMLAEDVSTALDHLYADVWDALIVDIRLPPGPNAHWRKLYQRTGANKVHAQLGLKLIQWLLRGDKALFPKDPPSWVREDRIGVFSVESRREVGEHLDSLGIEVFQQKVASLPDTILEELIGRLLGNLRGSQ